RALLPRDRHLPLRTPARNGPPPRFRRGGLAGRGGGAGRRTRRERARQPPSRRRAARPHHQALPRAARVAPPPDRSGRQGLELVAPLLSGTSRPDSSLADEPSALCSATGDAWGLASVEDGLSSVEVGEAGLSTV